MTLTDIYRRFASGEIDRAMAAAEFGISERALTIRIGRRGDKLVFLLSTLDRIVADEIDRDEAARILGVSTRQVNKDMERWGVQRPLKEYLVHRELTSLKWDSCKKHAVDFIAGSTTLKSAAAGANQSERQMRRWISKLLGEYDGIVFKDLEKISDPLRCRLAKNIMTGEQIDVATQKVLTEIAAGRLRAEDEALARVLASGKRRAFRG